MLIPILFLAATSIQRAEPTVPSRQPQLSAARGLVAMTFGSGSSIYFASSSDQGKTWNAPVKVIEASVFALGRHRGPRVAILKDSIVISAVIGEKGTKQAGTLTAFRSVDNGKTWSRGGVINDVPEAAREGLHAMTAAPDGSLFAAWLDLRATGTRLYGAKSTDGGITWSKNVAMYTSPDGTICQCCHPTLAVDSSGRVFGMWRNVVDGSRDFYVTSSTDGVHFDAAARKLGEGTWKLNACPMDGGGLAVEDGKITSAWRRDGEIFLTEPGVAAERRVGTGKDVALARNHKHQTYLVWTKDGGLQVLMPDSREPVALSADGAFATLVALEDGGVLAAWETHDSIETKRLDR
jgi:BNR repeat-like domain